MATYEYKTPPGHTFSPVILLYKLQAFNQLYSVGTSDKGVVFLHGRSINSDKGLIFRPQNLVVTDFGRKYLTCIHKEYDGKTMICRIDTTKPDHGIEYAQLITMPQNWSIDKNA